jgi:phosphopantetheinyl transferase (holo-ACP synthase)
VGVDEIELPRIERILSRRKARKRRRLAERGAA